MSVTFKFGKVDKDSPSLNVLDEPYALAGHSLLAHPATEDALAVPDQIKFPMWFRHNQQQQVLREVSRRFNDLALQWHAMDIPDSETVWASPAVLNQNIQPSSLAEQGGTQENQYILNIIWPASNERIASKTMNPQAAVSLDSGHCKLKLHVDGREYNLSVAVSPNYGQVDNTREVLQRLAVAINSQQLQVKAMLQETVNPSDPMAPYRMPARGLQLVVEGQAQNFYLEDVEGTLAAAYGLDRNQLGAEAYARVAEGQGREVNINDLVGVVWDSANGQFAVRAASGPRSLLNAVQRFVFSYNDLVDYIAQNSDYLRPSLKDRLIRPQQDRAGSLSEVGLKVEPRGHIIPGRSFVQNMLVNYKTTCRRLLSGEGAWAAAFMEQTKTIEQLGLENYTSPLMRQSEEQVRSRAWLALDSLREKIISAYY